MHHVYRHTFIVKVKNDEQKDKNNPKRAVTSEEDKKEISEGREKVFKEKRLGKVKIWVISR